MGTAYARRAGIAPGARALLRAVLDGERAPIEMVSEGDLIHAKRAVRESRRQTWLELLA